jgi:polysaccharide export outer membrane protein
MKTLVALFALAAVLAGQAWAETAAVTARSAATVPGRASVAAGNYIIGPEDTLQVVVWKNETLTRQVNVRPDGFISLPLVDDIEASGLTVLQLRDVVVKRLSEFMPTPDVSIIVSEVRSFKVSIMGEIARPGRYELRSWTTVLDVLAQAGGFTSFASRSKIVVLRPNGKKMERIPFNYNRVIQAGGEDENFYLRPNDIVLVP